jgi:hypothetical protein
MRREEPVRRRVPYEAIAALCWGGLMALFAGGVSAEWTTSDWALRGCLSGRRGLSGLRCGGHALC